MAMTFGTYSYYRINTSDKNKLNGLYGLTFGNEEERWSTSVRKIKIAERYNMTIREVKMTMKKFNPIFVWDKSWRNSEERIYFSKEKHARKMVEWLNSLEVVKKIAGEQ